MGIVDLRVNRNGKMPCGMVNALREACKRCNIATVGFKQIEIEMTIYLNTVRLSPHVRYWSIVAGLHNAWDMRPVMLIIRGG